MKILYILPFVPWPIKVRSYNLIPRLARRHEISLVCLSSAPPSAEQLESLRGHCKRVVHMPHSRLQGMMQCVAALPTRKPLRIAYCCSKRAKEAVRKVYEEVEPDVVYVERWRALQLVPGDAGAPVLCDPTDSMTLYNRRLMKAGAWWERLVGWEEYVKFQRYEGELARRTDVSVFCSQVDLACVRELAPEAQYELIPNGVDCEKFFFKDQREEQTNTVIFTGSFKYRPNCHAVEFFLKRIFPLIQKEIPEAKFLAVGNGASRALSGHLGEAAFEAVDFVPDLRPYLAAASVAVAPLTIGSGVSNKLLEGFATGTPVIATPLACGDLPVKSEEHLMIAGEAKEFAEHTIRLLRDAGLRRRMAVCARGLVEGRYDWEIVTQKMESVMQELVLARMQVRREESVQA